MYKKKFYNIALVGLGNIGSYLFNYLKSNRNLLINKKNSKFYISYISAKNKNKKKNIKFKKSMWVNNFLDITKKKDVDIIIELIGGAEGPAKKLVFQRLKTKNTL